MVGVGYIRGGIICLGRRGGACCKNIPDLGRGRFDSSPSVSERFPRECIKIEGKGEVRLYLRQGKNSKRPVPNLGIFVQNPPPPIGSKYFTPRTNTNKYSNMNEHRPRRSAVVHPRHIRRYLFSESTLFVHRRIFGIRFHYTANEYYSDAYCSRILPGYQVFARDAETETVARSADIHARCITLPEGGEGDGEEPL